MQSRNTSLGPIYIIFLFLVDGYIYCEFSFPNAKDIVSYCNPFKKRNVVVFT